MVSQSEASAWAAEADALTVLAAAEFASQAADLADINPTVAAGLIRDLAAELAAEYGRASSLLSAEWYEELRPSGTFTATLLEPDIDKLQNDLSWAMRDLFAEEADAAAAVSRSAEVTDLAVRNAGRGTILTNMRRDPLDVRYARHASATACAFCALLATRQATYRSEETAGIEAHRSDHCIAVPVWPGQEVEEAPYVAAWRDAYYESREAVGGDTKAILAEMRQRAGLR